MDLVPQNKFLEIKPDSLEVIRKHYDMEKPGIMKEAVNIFIEWIQKQPHFTKKDFSVHYLELTILSCKGSMERAKNQLDKICTLRNLLPQFFGVYNAKTDFNNMLRNCYTLVLPKTTEDYYRVYVCKFFNAPQHESEYLDYFRFNVLLAEYIKAHDYINGFILVVDFTDANVMDYVTKLNPMELRHCLSIFIEGFGMKIKGIHILSPSKVIDTLVSILKQILSQKIANRIHVHKSAEQLHNFIPKEVLPKDQGGEERSLRTLQDEWNDILSSDEHMEYLREMNASATDETYRLKHQFSEQYAGMPGTFRLLSVD